MSDNIEQPQPEGSCSFCGDFSAHLHIHARCHPAAPLRAELSEGYLTLFCYLPDCNRRVGQFKITEIKP